MYSKIEFGDVACYLAQETAQIRCIKRYIAKLVPNVHRNYVAKGTYRMHVSTLIIVAGLAVTSTSYPVKPDISASDFTVKPSLEEVRPFINSRDAMMCNSQLTGVDKHVFIAAGHTLGSMIRKGAGDGVDVRPALTLLERLTKAPSLLTDQDLKSLEDDLDMYASRVRHEFTDCQVKYFKETMAIRHDPEKRALVEALPEDSDDER